MKVKVDQTIVLQRLPILAVSIVLVMIVGAILFRSIRELKPKPTLRQQHLH